MCDTIATAVDDFKRQQWTRTAQSTAPCSSARLNEGILPVLKQLINFGGELSHVAENFREFATPLRTFLLANGAVATRQDIDSNGYRSLPNWCLGSTTGEFVGGVTPSGFLC